jgi:hypothetical protein
MSLERIGSIQNLDAYAAGQKVDYARFGTPDGVAVTSMLSGLGFAPKADTAEAYRAAVAQAQTAMGIADADGKPGPEFINKATQRLQETQSKCYAPGQAPTLNDQQASDFVSNHKPERNPGQAEQIRSKLDALMTKQQAAHPQAPTPAPITCPQQSTPQPTSSKGQPAEPVAKNGQPEPPDHRPAPAQASAQPAASNLVEDALQTRAARSPNRGPGKVEHDKWQSALNIFQKARSEQRDLTPQEAFSVLPAVKDLRDQARVDANTNAFRPRMTNTHLADQAEALAKQLTLNAGT